ncbi:RNA polymerase sigma factor [Streptomyces sp. NPDC048171]|uniref:RNA polymerase sigma factor n=1 Tax=Streptomyces sp. NPDC048171 TaxID=3365504 RepID=UPI0037243CB0
MAIRVTADTETPDGERTGTGVELSLRTRIRAGDPQAFSQLFREHAGAVSSHALRLTGDWNTAEDVVSLTFLEAWRLREKLLPDSAPANGTRPGATVSVDDAGLRPWLFGIATNVLRNTQRAARRHKAALARIPVRRADIDTVSDFADELVSRMEDAERLAAARTALGYLPRREREVFTLCVWSGLSYAAAAEALGVPVTTVRSRLSRARKRLRAPAEAELARKLGQSHARAALPEGAAMPPEVDQRAGHTSGSGQETSGRTTAARLTQEYHR